MKEIDNIDYFDTNDISEMFHKTINNTINKSISTQRSLASHFFTFGIEKS